VYLNKQKKQQKQKQKETDTNSNKKNKETRNPKQKPRWGERLPGKRLELKASNK
jgi:hypothetical protein